VGEWLSLQLPGSFHNTTSITGGGWKFEQAGSIADGVPDADGWVKYAKNTNGDEIEIGRTNCSGGCGAFYDDFGGGNVSWGTGTEACGGGTCSITYMSPAAMTDAVQVTAAADYGSQSVDASSTFSNTFDAQAAAQSLADNANADANSFVQSLLDPGYASSSAPATATLTASQEAQARSIAENDSFIQDVLDGRSYTVDSVAPWTTNDNQLIGSRVVLSWSTPVNLTKSWPAISYDDSEQTNPPYTDATPVSFTLNRVTELDVLVDLSRNRAVAVTPAAATAYIPGAREPASVDDVPDDAEHAGTTDPKKVHFFNILGDTFFVYDFTKITPPQEAAPSYKTVDWPVSLIFWGNADKDRVNPPKYKKTIHGKRTGDPMYGLVDDGFDTGWHWDQDNGSKKNTCRWQATHYRVYGDPFSDSDVMYNRRWQYYLIGTTHYDYYECHKTIGPSSGLTEEAEHDVARARLAGEPTAHLVTPPRPGYPHGRTGFDTLWLGNYEPLRVTGSGKLWHNDGKATMIKID
jgi:hypothetical protein